MRSTVLVHKFSMSEKDSHGIPIDMEVISALQNLIAAAQDHTSRHVGLKFQALLSNTSSELCALYRKVLLFESFKAEILFYEKICGDFQVYMRETPSSQSQSIECWTAQMNERYLHAFAIDTDVHNRDQVFIGKTNGSSCRKSRHKSVIQPYS
jgi:hypothetical protein